MLYNNSESSGKEIKEEIPFPVATKINKMPGNKFKHKEVKDFYNESYSSLMKVVEAYLQKICLFSWIGNISIIRVCILRKVIYRFNATPTKISLAFLTQLEKILLILYRTTKVPNHEQKVILSKRTKQEPLHYLTFKYSAELQ